MDQKQLIKYALIGLGVYLVYEYLQAHGGLAGFLGSVTGIGTGTTGAVPGAGASTGPGAPAVTAPHPGGWMPTDYVPCVGGVAVWNSGPDANTAQYRSTPQSAALVKCAMPAATGAGTSSGAPTPAGSTVSQKMQAAAGANSFNFDQWCYYYTQVTGQPCPVDPGSIDPSVYQGAGIVDRTTPTDVNTWLAIIQSQAPSAGVSGLPAAWGHAYTPAWLM